MVVVGDGHFSTPFPVGVLGLITGTEYAALGGAAVLLYRRVGVINFSLASLGALAAAVMGALVSNHTLSYWPAVAIGVCSAAVVSGVLGLAIRLRFGGDVGRNGTLVTIVATIALGAAYLVVNSHAAESSTFVGPTGFPTFNVGNLRVTPTYSAMLFLAIPGLLATYGVDRVAGVRFRTAPLWLMTGALAGLLSILDAPTRSFGSNSPIPMTLRLLAVAAVAGFDSVPLAVLGGLGLGVVEVYVLWNWPSAGATDWAVAPLLVLAGFAWRSRARSREVAAEIWRLRPAWSLAAVLVVGTGACFALSEASTPHHVTLAGIAGITVLAMSFGLVSNDRINLGVPAVALASAYAAHACLHATSEALIAIVVAAAAGAVAMVVIAVAARGLGYWQYAMFTLGLTLTAGLLSLHFTPEGLVRQPESFIGMHIQSSTRMAWLVSGVAVVALLAGTLAAWRPRPWLVTPVSGALAGLGGFCVYSILFFLSPVTLSTSTVLPIAAVAIVGGRRAPVGSVLGALLLLVLPAYVKHLTALEELGIGLTALAIVLVTPAGLARPLLRRVARPGEAAPTA